MGVKDMQRVVISAVCAQRIKVYFVAEFDVDVWSREHGKEMKLKPNTTFAEGEYS